MTLYTKMTIQLGNVWGFTEQCVGQQTLVNYELLIEQTIGKSFHLLNIVDVTFLTTYFLVYL